MDSNLPPSPTNTPQSTPPVPPAPKPVPTSTPTPRPDLPPPPPPVSPQKTTPIPPVSSATPPPPPTRSGFNKRPIFIIVFLLLLLVAGFLLFRKFVNLPGSKQVTLTYWGLWESEEIIRPVLTQFEEQHPNIKIDYKQQSHLEYRERLQSLISQNKGPDVFRIHNTWIPMFRNSLSPLPESVYSASEFQSLFYPTAYLDLRVGNSLYALPLEIDGLAMYINDDLLTAAGQSVPETWDDLRNVAVATSKCATQDSICRPGSQIIVSGAALGTTENVDHWQDIVAILMLQNNVDLNHPDKPSPGPADDVINYYKSFYESYNVWEPALPSSTSLFIDGRVAIYFAPSWRVFEIKAANPDLKFSVYPLPQVPVEADRQEQPVTWASYWVEAVNKRSEHATESWELLKFLSSPEVLKKLYGQSVLLQRQFGEPYSRTDLAGEIETEQYVGAYIQQAPLARSWYLTSFTHDGPTGINTRISDAFVKVLNRRLGVSGLAGEINTILSEYGVSAPNPVGQ